MDHTTSSMRSSAGNSLSSSTGGGYITQKTSTHPFLKSKHRVGTCHQNINYDNILMTSTNTMF